MPRKKSKGAPKRRGRPPGKPDKKAREMRPWQEIVQERFAELAANPYAPPPFEMREVRDTEDVAQMLREDIEHVAARYIEGALQYDEIRKWLGKYHKERGEGDRFRELLPTRTPKQRAELEVWAYKLAGMNIKTAINPATGRGYPPKERSARAKQRREGLELFEDNKRRMTLYPIEAGVWLLETSPEVILALSAYVEAPRQLEARKLLGMVEMRGLAFEWLQGRSGYVGFARESVVDKQSPSPQKDWHAWADLLTEHYAAPESGFQVPEKPPRMSRMRYWRETMETWLAKGLTGWDG